MPGSVLTIVPGTSTFSRSGCVATAIAPSLSCGYYALDISVAIAPISVAIAPIVEPMPVKKHLKLKEVDTRKLRQGLGLNQAQFGERLEITQSSGSRYESG